MQPHFGWSHTAKASSLCCWYLVKTSHSHCFFLGLNKPCVILKGQGGKNMLSFSIRFSLLFPVSKHYLTGPKNILMGNSTTQWCFASLLFAGFSGLCQGWSWDSSEPWSRRGWLCMWRRGVRVGCYGSETVNLLLVASCFLPFALPTKVKITFFEVASRLRWGVDCQVSRCNQAEDL